jgi:23S rRNA (cytosine1962-C5)-methyltransferase
LWSKYVAFEGLVDISLRVSPLAERIRKSAHKRAALAQVNDVYRLVDAEGDEFAGVVIERYGDYAVVFWSDTWDAPEPLETAQALGDLGARGVYLKERIKGDLRRLEPGLYATGQVAAGSAAPEGLSVAEGKLRFEVALGDGYSTGLFVDQRQNREWLLKSAHGKQVLNLFSYTGSFSVAAGVGGAARVTSVDLSGRALKRVDANLRLNGLPQAQHRLLKADAVSWLRRAVARGERYDLVVLDPPSFASVGNETFSVARQYAQLVGSCAQLMAPGGSLLAVTNHRGTSVSLFHEWVQQACREAGHLNCRLEARPAGLDCPAAGLAPDGGTKSVLVHF